MAQDASTGWQESPDAAVLPDALGLWLMGGRLPRVALFLPDPPPGMMLPGAGVLATAVFGAATAIATLRDLAAAWPATPPALAVNLALLCLAAATGALAARGLIAAWRERQAAAQGRSRRGVLIRRDDMLIIEAGRLIHIPRAAVIGPRQRPTGGGIHQPTREIIIRLADGRSLAVGIGGTRLWSGLPGWIGSGRLPPVA